MWQGGQAGKRGGAETVSANLFIRSTSYIRSNTSPLDYSDLCKFLPDKCSVSFLDFFVFILPTVWSNVSLRRED